MARSDPKRAEIDQALADADPEARAKLRRMLQNPRARDAVLRQAPDGSDEADGAALSEEEAREIEDARAYYLSTGEFRKALDRAAVGRHIAKRTAPISTPDSEDGAHPSDAPRVHDPSAETLDVDTPSASSKQAPSSRRPVAVVLLAALLGGLAWLFWPGASSDADTAPSPTSTPSAPSTASPSTPAPSAAAAGASTSAAPTPPTGETASSASSTKPPAPSPTSPTPPATRPPSTSSPTSSPTPPSAPPPAPPASSAPWEGIYP